MIKSKERCKCDYCGEDILEFSIDDRENCANMLHEKCVGKFHMKYDD